MSRYVDLVQRLERAVLDGPARLPPVARRAAAAGAPADSDTATYVEKVRLHAYQVTDADVAALRRAGWDDEAIFELTVATAVGAGLRQLDIGLTALAAARAKAGK